MIKSIVKHANGTSSIELSSKEDIESIGTNYGLGSKARVTGQITEEYILGQDGWEMVSQYGSGNQMFIIEFTPENEDLSGSIDTTVAEIVEALKSGKTVVARINLGHHTAYCYLADFVYHDEYEYPSLNFTFYNTLNNILVYAYTGYTDAGDLNTYSVIPYTLTPAI